MAWFGINATTRASLAMYNTREDVDALVAALRKISAGASAKPETSASSVPKEWRFPEASAVSPAAAADELAGVFELLGDRDARNQYILELGEKLSPLPAALKIDVNRVHGCMSTVHLFGRKREDGRLDFLADSDAHILRGLVGLLEKL